MLESGDESGPARCYFCGHRIAEEDIQKTDYHVGHGHHMLVLICPECRGKKERREGPFARKWSATIGGCIALAVFLAFAGFVASRIFGLSFTNLVTSWETVPAGKSATSGGLTLTVDKVEKGAGGFRVHMTATNRGGESLTLPIFGYFKVIDDLGGQYAGEPFSSTFPRDVAPGATVSGYAHVKSKLNPSASTVRVMFTTVFGSFAVNSITVEGVPVRGKA